MSKTPCAFAHTETPTALSWRFFCPFLSHSSSSSSSNLRGRGAALGGTPFVARVVVFFFALDPIYLRLREPCLTNTQTLTLAPSLLLTPSLCVCIAFGVQCSVRLDSSHSWGEVGCQTSPSTGSAG